MEQKSNHGLAIALFLSIMLIVGLGGYVAYDKLITDNHICEEEECPSRIDNNDEKLPETDFSSFVGRYHAVVDPEDASPGAYIELKVDGTFIQNSNMCEGFYKLEGTYYIFGTETDDPTLVLKHSDFQQANFDIVGKELRLQAVTIDMGEGFIIIRHDEDMFFDCSHTKIFRKQ